MIFKNNKIIVNLLKSWDNFIGYNKKKCEINNNFIKVKFKVITKI